MTDLNLTISEDDLSATVRAALVHQTRTGHGNTPLFDAVSLCIARKMREVADDGTIARLVSAAVEKYAQKVIDERVLDAIERRAKKAVKEALAKDVPLFGGEKP